MVLFPAGFFLIILFETFFAFFMAFPTGFFPGAFFPLTFSRIFFIIFITVYIQDSVYIVFAIEGKTPFEIQSNPVITYLYFTIYYTISGGTCERNNQA